MTSSSFNATLSACIVVAKTLQDTCEAYAQKMISRAIYGLECALVDTLDPHVKDNLLRGAFWFLHAAYSYSFDYTDDDGQDDPCFVQFNQLLFDVEHLEVK